MSVFVKLLKVQNCLVFFSPGHSGTGDKSMHNCADGLGTAWTVVDHFLNDVPFLGTWLGKLIVE